MEERSAKSSILRRFHVAIGVSKLLLTCPKTDVVQIISYVVADSASSYKKIYIPQSILRSPQKGEKGFSNVSTKNIIEEVDGHTHNQ